MSNELIRRVTELEMQLAHLQRQYDQLNEVVVQQSMEADRNQRRIVELQRQVRSIKEKQESQQEADPLDEKPPHY